MQRNILNIFKKIQKGTLCSNLNDYFVSFEEMQRKYILQVLESTRWRVSGEKGAAKILDMNAKTLFAKMKKLGIER